jgi:hypothetical protein
MTFDDFKKLTRRRTTVADILAMPGSKNIELPIPPLRDLPRIADLA